MYVSSLNMLLTPTNSSLKKKKKSNKFFVRILVLRKDLVSTLLPMNIFNDVDVL